MCVERFSFLLFSLQVLLYIFTRTDRNLLPCTDGYEGSRSRLEGGQGVCSRRGGQHARIRLDGRPVDSAEEVRLPASLHPHSALHPQLILSTLQPHHQTRQQPPNRPLLRYLCRSRPHFRRPLRPSSERDQAQAGGAESGRHQAVLHGFVVCPFSFYFENAEKKDHADNGQYLRTDCDNEEHKYEVLVELYNLLTIGQSIIFVKVRFLPSFPSLSRPLLVFGLTSLFLFHSAATPPTKSRVACPPKATKSPPSMASSKRTNATPSWLPSETARPKSLSRPTSSLAESTSRRSTWSSTTTCRWMRRTDRIRRRICTGLVRFALFPCLHLRRSPSRVARVSLLSTFLFSFSSGSSLLPPSPLLHPAPPIPPLLPLLYSHLPSRRTCRSNRSFRSSRCLHQLRPRPPLVRKHGGDPSRAREAHC
jgi:hypothetical protein